ncbi:LysR family transcriptional regulator [Roseovarius aquimarinus]|uniref:LysR family transcriptional regulator n=1 Tax=Roseovarius aquimarinus TaxID=1229156 RepID=A0ABW7IB92_9RHOB
MFKIATAHSASFLVACEEGSIRSASERLGVEPSTITRHIQSLETSLGAALIERGHTGICPTEAGQILQTYLKRQQCDEEALLSEFDALKGMRRGQLVIAVGDGFISDFIGNALRLYRGSYPGFTYDLLSGSTEQVLHAVRTDQAHLGMAYNARKERSIKTAAQSKQPLELLVSPHSDWANLPEPMTMKALEHLPAALLKSGSGVGDMIQAAEGAHGVRLNAVVQSNSLAVLRNFVRDGLGVTILPAFVVTREIADGTIVTKRLDIPELSRGEASLFTRAGRRLPEGASRLAHHIARAMVAFRAAG